MGRRLLTIASLPLLLAASANADSATDRQLAQSLFDSARAAMAQGDFAKACPLLQESQKLDPGGGTLLNLAVCHENEGRLTTAMVEFNDALSQAIKESRRDREKTAREHIVALTPRLPKLVLISRTELPADTTIELDGSPVTRLVLGVPMPLDPGKHSVRVSAPGRTPFEKEFSLNERETSQIEIAELLPLLAILGGPATSNGNVIPPPPRYEMRQSVGFWIFGGVAIAALGTSAVTGVLALNKQSDSRSACRLSRSYCPQSAIDDADDARSLAWVSTGFLTGGAFAALMALSFPRVRVPVAVSPSREGVTVQSTISF